MDEPSLQHGPQTQQGTRAVSGVGGSALPVVRTDAQLVGDVLALAVDDPKRRDALDALYRRHGPMVHALLLVRVSPSDADDLTQEVLLKAAKNLAQLRDPTLMGPWLAGIARAEAANFRRSAWRRGLRLAGLARERPRVIQVPLSKGGSKDLGAGEVLDAIRLLPEAYQEPLLLRLVEGLTGPQIAAALGLTHGSVRVNLTRGMAMLRERLGLEGGGRARGGPRP